MPPYIKNTLLNFFSFFLIAFSLYIFISLVSYNPSDSGSFNINNNEDPIENLGGPLGAIISDFLYTLIGYGGYALLLIGCVWSIQTLFYEDPNNSLTKILVRLISSIFFIVCFCSVGQLYITDDFGGAIGVIVLKALTSLFGSVGSLIFLVVLLIPTTSFSFNFSWLEKLDQFGKLLISTFKYGFKVFKNFLVKIKNIISSIFANSKKIVNTMQDSSKVKKVKSSKSKTSTESGFNKNPSQELKNDLKEYIRAYEKIIDDPRSIPLIDNLAEIVLDEDDQKSSEDFDYEIPEYEPTIREAKEKVYSPKKSKNNKKNIIPTKPSKRVGRAGEEHVYNFEYKKLMDQGREDLAKQIVKQYEDLSFFPGYDIKSFNEDGEEIYIEVKSTVSKGKDYFEISDNEVLAAKSLEGSYFIYQVTDALANPKISSRVRNPMKYVEENKILLESWIYKMFIH